VQHAVACLTCARPCRLCCAQPLHSAARCDYWWNDDESAAKTIAYLVSKGANITARTKGGDTVGCMHQPCRPACLLVARLPGRLRPPDD